jgi:hypothetical protein
MCNQVTKPLFAFFRSNFTRPNLLVKGPSGHWDLTATFARIEAQYGSRTQCDEAEANRRRAQKELIKLKCVRYAISGWQEGEDNDTAEHWLLPDASELDSHYYTAFTDPEVLKDFGEQNA